MTVQYALIHRYLQKLSIDEISDIYMIDRESAKKKLQRARNKLRTQMVEAYTVKLP